MFCNKILMSYKSVYICVWVFFLPLKVIFSNRTALPSGYPAAPCQAACSLPNKGGKGCQAPCLGSHRASHWPGRWEQLSHWWNKQVLRVLVSRCVLISVIRDVFLRAGLLSQRMMVLSWPRSVSFGNFDVTTYNEVVAIPVLTRHLIKKSMESYSWCINNLWLLRRLILLIGTLFSVCCLLFMSLLLPLFELLGKPISHRLQIEVNMIGR